MKRISVFIVFALLISIFATAKKKEIQTFRITQEERQLQPIRSSAEGENLKNVGTTDGKGVTLKARSITTFKN